MPPENLNMDDITEERRKALQKSIRPISIEELKALEDELFPYLDHPWRQRYVEFLAENKGRGFFHATTQDRVNIIYCHEKDKGIWYIPGSGLGPLQEKGLKIMKAIVSKV